MSSLEVAFRVGVREMAKVANSCNRTSKVGSRVYGVFCFSEKRSRRPYLRGYQQQKDRLAEIAVYTDVIRPWSAIA